MGSADRRCRKSIKAIVAISQRFLAIVLVLALIILFGVGCLSRRQYSALPKTEAYAMERMVASPAMLPETEGEFPPEGDLPPEDAVDYNTEEYLRIVDNPFKGVVENPVSTFSVDVDTASYANVRRYLVSMGQKPPADAVRIEELVNYFPYSYAQVEGEHPVEARFMLSEAPWNGEHWLLRVALKAREVETGELPASNLVFLLDTSGSMSDENKLPLVKDGMKVMVEQLRPQDRVAIVAYAGSAGLVMASTSASERERILGAFDRLEAGGSTAGGEGIRLAYEVARRNFIAGGNTRVVLATDGDFNVGVRSTADLERLGEAERAGNVYLTGLGVGMGNYKDTRLETLADKGNGNYAYLDNLLEAKKVLGKEFWGNVYAVAKDVKVQIEFNPARVREWRLIGYENRVLAREDFADDTKDAGEMGSGHTVTAFYELVPPGAPATTGAPPVEPLVFQSQAVVDSADLLEFRLRYKEPGGGDAPSVAVTRRLGWEEAYTEPGRTDNDWRFASAVVEFGMLLRDSPYRGDASYTAAMERARGAKGEDYDGYRAEFIRLVELADAMSK